MKQFIEKIICNTETKQILDITEIVKKKINEKDLHDGLLNLSILHTSCSLMIQENADQTVMMDIKNFLNQLAPEKNYHHNTEGPDDMPAHLKSMITNTNLTLTVKEKKLVLGIWQGIFLLEHRNKKNKREILFHFIGD